MAGLPRLDPNAAARHKELRGADDVAVRGPCGPRVPVACIQHSLKRT
jgi:hypothetical protein